MGAVLLPIMTLAMSSLSRAEVGRATAAFSVVQRVGAPFGVTVIAVLLQSRLAGGAAADAFSTTFWWVIALSVAPLVLALLLPSSRHPVPPAEAERPLEPAQPGLR